MIALDNVIKVYQTQGGPRRVLDQIDLHIEKGEHVGILGRNGAGNAGADSRRTAPPLSPAHGRLAYPRGVSYADAAPRRGGPHDRQYDRLVHELVDALSIQLTAREHRLLGRDVAGLLAHIHGAALGMGGADCGRKSKTETKNE